MPRPRSRRVEPSADALNGIRLKRAAGMLPPQECPQCKADLSDDTVPEQYAAYADMFGIAIEIAAHEPDRALWRCPFCNHTWQPHPRTNPGPPTKETP